MMGRWHGAPYHDYSSKKWLITLELDSPPAEYDKTKDKPLNITIKQYREGRSKDANALMWACIGDLAAALRADKWDIYLKMLKRYGQYTYVCVIPEAVEMIRKQWREVEEVGRGTVNGVESVQLLCYFGSSTMNSKEFSVLLDGVISEMKEMGLPTPDRDLERVLKQLEETNEKNKSDNQKT